MCVESMYDIDKPCVVCVHTFSFHPLKKKDRYSEHGKRQPNDDLCLYVLYVIEIWIYSTAGPHPRGRELPTPTNNRYQSSRRAFSICLSCDFKTKQTAFVLIRTGTKCCSFEFFYRIRSVNVFSIRFYHFHADLVDYLDLVEVAITYKIRWLLLISI